MALRGQLRGYHPQLALPQLACFPYSLHPYLHYTALLPRISVQERRTIVALSLTRAARVELFTDTRIIGINGIVCIRELFVNAAYSHRRLY